MPFGADCLSHVSLYALIVVYMVVGRLSPTVGKKANYVCGKLGMLVVGDGKDM